jgi:hypothetical protein
MEDYKFNPLNPSIRCTSSIKLYGVTINKVPVQTRQFIAFIVMGTHNPVAWCIVPHFKLMLTLQCQINKYVPFEVESIIPG